MSTTHKTPPEGDGIKMFKISIFIAVIGLAPGGCSTFPRTNEKLDWNVSEDFELAYRENTGWHDIEGRDAYEYAYERKDGTNKNWTERAISNELVRSEMLGSAGFRWNPESIMLYINNSYAKKNCTIEGINVLDQSETSILYVWENISCTDLLDNYMVVRIVVGRWHAWMIHYGVRNKELSQQERDKYIENLMSAKIVVIK